MSIRRFLGTLEARAVPRTWRLVFGRNPLRRGTDRIEGMVLCLLMALFVLSLAGAGFLGTRIYAAGSAAAAAETATRHATTAVVRENVAIPANGSMANDAYATWSGPDGRTHVGDIPLPAGTEVGARTVVWVDASGRPTSPPRSHTDTIVIATDAGLGAAAGSGALLLLVFAAARRLLDRARLTRWDAEWQLVARKWTMHG